jgi:hypothetical protein
MSKLKNTRNDLHIRLNEIEKKTIEENANKFGFHTVSEFVRYVSINIKEIKILMDK